MSDALKGKWVFDARDVRLNHGSFGATPLHILSEQEQIERAFNTDREAFFNASYFEELGRAQARIAKLSGASPDDLVITENATEAFNTIIKSPLFEAGDEILVTSHIYSNFKSPLRALEQTAGVHLVIADPPFPVKDEQEITDAVMRAKTAIRGAA